MARRALLESPVDTLAKAVRLVVIHDDMPAGLAAQQWIDDRLRGGQPDLRFWGHDIIAHGELWQQVSEDVAGADTLVFAMSNRSVLPLRMVNWMRIWEEGRLLRAERLGLLTSAAVADGSLSCIAQRFLSGFARRHCSSFFHDCLPASFPTAARDGRPRPETVTT